MDRIELSLSLCGISHFFKESVFSSTMVTHGKPAPDLFLHAARVMDYAPSDCVVIEDSLPGIEAAKAASMRVIGFLGGSHLQPNHSDAMRAQGASAIAESWDQVADILQTFGIS
jgi:beta-phosphoglucomutase-like phosphatase (HAD superfamily)